MFELSIKKLDGQKVIDFANNSKEFVEVVFTIDGKEVKEGKAFSTKIKGYAYPPKLEKPVKKMRDGSNLRFSARGGEVTAYIYAGEGGYKDEDMDKPTLLRNKMVDKVKFKRGSDKPIEVIKVKY